MTDFIAVYEQALSADVCEQVLAQFEASTAKTAGRIGQGVETKKKDSTDLAITGVPEWKPLHDQMIETTLPFLERYVREYPFLVAGSLALRLKDQATGEEFDLSADSLDRVPSNQLRGVIMALYRSGVLNLQKYQQGRGGYHHWHSEIFPRDAQCETLHRVLLYMYYLNDVAEGGETEFFYQQRKIKPTRGTLVIAPAGFTHTHKGHIPLSGDKYIATSWVMFNRAEMIFSQARPR